MHLIFLQYLVHNKKVTLVVILYLIFFDVWFVNICVKKWECFKYIFCVPTHYYYFVFRLNKKRQGMNHTLHNKRI